MHALSKQLPDETHTASQEEREKRVHLEILAARLTFLMNREICIGRSAKGWTAAFHDQDVVDWPPLFGRPLSHADLVQSLSKMLEAFEPRSPNSLDDATLRQIAQEIEEEDPEGFDFVFVAYRGAAYDITFLRAGRDLADEEIGLSFEAAKKVLNDLLPCACLNYDPQDDVYIGSGRDYGAY